VSRKKEIRGKRIRPGARARSVERWRTRLINYMSQCAKRINYYTRESMREAKLKAKL